MRPQIIERFAGEKVDLTKENLEYAKGILLMIKDISVAMPVIDQALEGINSAIERL